MMSGTGNTDRDIELGRYRLSGQTNLPRMRTPAEITGHAACANCGIELARQTLQNAKSVRSL
jgi:hypothetical protein